MKRILIILSAVVLALGLSSCNGKIENPTARNFIGTWDLISTDVVATDGTVTSTPCKSLDYLVIEETPSPSTRATRSRSTASSPSRTR